jgi:hypothetical protein
VKIPTIPVWFCKGATAYEVQVGKVVFRWTFLWGGYWNWKLWRRFSVKIFPREEA